MFRVSVTTALHGRCHAAHCSLLRRPSLDELSRHWRRKGCDQRPAGQGDLVRPDSGARVNADNLPGTMTENVRPVGGATAVAVAEYAVVLLPVREQLDKVVHSRR